MKTKKTTRLQDTLSKTIEYSNDELDSLAKLPALPMVSTYDLGGEPVSDAIAMIDEAIAETARHNHAFDFTTMHAALLELSAEIERYSTSRLLARADA